MPHIRPGCHVDYGVGRILFAGEVAGFLNPMGEGISAGMESGYCAASAVMKHFDNPETVREAYRQSTENLKSCSASGALWEGWLARSGRWHKWEKEQTEKII